MIDEELIKKRLLASVQKRESGCWEWQKAKRSKYGVIKVAGKLESAHRISFGIFVSKVSAGICVCHRCDNPVCINPDHLFLCSQSENMKDALAKGRMRVPAGPLFQVGHIPSTASITKEQAIQIRERILDKGNMTLKKLAEELLISYQLIRDINCGRVYK